MAKTVPWTMGLTLAWLGCSAGDDPGSQPIQGTGSTSSSTLGGTTLETTSTEGADTTDATDTEDGPLDCVALFDCVEVCGDDEGCQASCFADATQAAVDGARAVAACAEAHGCGDETCLARDCAAELDACAGIDPGSPIIERFDVDSREIDVGGSAALIPVFSGGVGTITPDLGIVQSGVPIEIQPTDTTIYQLSIEGNDGTVVTQAVAVGVRKRPWTLVSLGAEGEPVDTSYTLSDGEHSVSADGRYVVFSSQDDALVADDGNGYRDIFVRDRERNETTCVSVTASGSTGDGDSDHAQLSPDGRFVFFQSSATNLGDPAVAGGYPQIYRHDRETQETVLVSVDIEGAPSSESCDGASGSADGRFVVFDCQAQLTELLNVSQAVYLRDVEEQTTSLVSVQSDGDPGMGYSATISADGTVIHYVGSDILGTGDDVAWQVYAVERGLTEATLVTSSPGGEPREQGNESASRSIVLSTSTDGARVSFCTTAGNLVGETPQEVQNVFVADLLSGTIVSPSVDERGALGNGDSVLSAGGRAPLSGDGTKVVFNTGADNLGFPTSSVLLGDLEASSITALLEGSPDLGDTDPALSPDPDGRFVLIRSEIALDPSSSSDGLFLHDRHVPPRADAGEDQVVAVGEDFTLDGSASEVVSSFPSPTPELIYAWMQLSGPSVVSIPDATIAQPTLEASEPGTWVFMLIVDDGLESSLPAFVRVNVE